MVAAQVLNRVDVSANPSIGCNEWSDRSLNDVICLFDVDGTLSLSRKVLKIGLFYHVGSISNIIYRLRLLR